jgi:hypothetical protein
MKLDVKLNNLIKKMLGRFKGANMFSDGARSKITDDIVDIVIKELKERKLIDENSDSR